MGLTIMLSLRISCAGQTPLFSSYADIIFGRPKLSKGDLLVMPSSQIGATSFALATLSNPIKVGEHCAFPSLTIALLAATGNFPLSMEKHIAP